MSEVHMRGALTGYNCESILDSQPKQLDEAAFFLCDITVDEKSSPFRDGTNARSGE
jgi:hypothetical protein